MDLITLWTVLWAKAKLFLYIEVRTDNLSPGFMLKNCPEY